ncbi:hypothetical protein NS184_14355 [Curtobacterium luteum]|uniref:Uncharacterized protein n=1 Tax=Curtobacterium luteum TaxID=33881 RepID=A0A175RJL4_9MICO|nr:hypothetical protein NS184_14355 [Curtobacterium luteum]
MVGSTATVVAGAAPVARPEHVAAAPGAPRDDAASATPQLGATASATPQLGDTAAATPQLGDTAAATPPLAVVVPDFPPDEDLLPPAPTSPAVHTLPFDQLVRPTSAPVSPVDAAPLTPPAAAAPPAPPTPAAPVVGQPRFSVPGLEHVVVAGSEPSPTGPVGYRTPARFAQRQAAAAPTTSAPASDPRVTSAPAPTGLARSGSGRTGADGRTVDEAPTVAAPVVREPAPTEPLLQAGAAPTGAATAGDRAGTRRIGAAPGALLGAVAGTATLGLAAWWFTAPGTVHGVGLVLGLLALLLSGIVLRDRSATWQRPVALLGAALGGVGTLVLLWAVASALLPAVGVTLPDLTGTGTVPALAP